jgi:hypothetical protein
VSRAELAFRSSAERWGLDFRHHHGASGERFMVETMVGGVVVFDYDVDGDPDVLFIDGGSLPGYTGEAARTRLFRNEGGQGFIDVTTESTLVMPDYGSGGSAGDIDNDGDLDLYLTGYFDNHLWRNNGDGTFSEITHTAMPPTETVWSASAGFSDVDRDGDLDLYSASYVDTRPDKRRRCDDQGIPIYCPPATYPGLPDVFYRNRGDGTFDDATEEVGLSPAEHMAGLGLVFGDLDNDGWPDLYVANDTEPNFLFHNKGDGTFEDKAFLWGTAVSERGKVEAGMGVDLGDVDGDGNLDIVVTNFEMETNALYKNLGIGLFIDSRYPLNVAESSLLSLAFGVAFADLDHDTDLDLIIANGHVRDNAEQFHAESHFAQRNQLLENQGGRFEEAEDVGLTEVRVSRGLACGDFDLDGDLDIVINNTDDLAESYENLGGSTGGAWLQADLRGETSNLWGIDTRLTLVVGDQRLVREVRTASSFLSQSSLTTHFGLGAAPGPVKLEVRWPSGKRQEFRGLSANRRVYLFEMTR